MVFHFLISQFHNIVILFQVNKMLNRVDLLVASLETKEKEIEAIKSVIGRTEEEKERDDENLVTVQELIDAVTKLQGTPDESKLEQISEVSLTSSYNFFNIKICNKYRRIFASTVQLVQDNHNR